MASDLPYPAQVHASIRDSAEFPADQPQRAAAAFVLELAAALHRYGTPAHQLEARLAQVAERLGLRANVFTTPTSIMVAFGDTLDQQTHLLRVEPGQPDLGHLAQVESITDDVLAGRLTPVTALARTRAIRSQPPRWPPWLGYIAYVLSSAAVATFLRLSPADLVAASLLGLIVGVIARMCQRVPQLSHVAEPLAAFVVATCAFAADTFIGTGAGYLVSLAGLVVLLPGLTFTVALTELSTRHLASGTARLSGAIVVFLGLGFGLALGARFGTLVGESVHALFGNLPTLATTVAQPAAVPDWTAWIALVIAPLSFTVLLDAERRDAPRIVAMCAAAYVVSRFAGARVGEELGAFLGAFVVSAASNVVGRLTRRSPMVTQVPGLLILVPGSIGFRSVTSFLGQQVEIGLAGAFRVGLIGISLAAGIVAGNLVAPGIRRPDTDVTGA